MRHCAASPAPTWQLSGSPGQSGWLSVLLKQVPGSEFFPHFRAALKLRAALRGEARPALCRQRGGGVKTFCRYQHNPAAAAICRSDLEADTEMIELLLITLTNVSVDLKSCKLYKPPPLWASGKEVSEIFLSKFSLAGLHPPSIVFALISIDDLSLNGRLEAYYGCNANSSWQKKVGVQVKCYPDVKPTVLPDMHKQPQSKRSPSAQTGNH